MLYFLVNPASRSFHNQKVWTVIEDYLREHHIRYKSFLLNSPNEARDIARSISQSQNKSVIVVVGGDGTLNECISGIEDFSRCIFGFIPAGSANDFSRALGISSDPLTALQMILSPKKTRALDIGLLEQNDGGSHKTHRFVISSGVGFDAAITCQVADSSMKPLLNKVRLGKLAYTLKALHLLIGTPMFGMRVTIDDKTIYTFKDTYFAVAMNCPYEGGGYAFCPDADPSDGCLDLIVAHGYPKSVALFIMVLIRLKLHTGLKNIQILRCSKAAVTLDAQEDPAWVHTDGEYACHSKKITWSVAKEKLRIIVS